MKRKITSVTLIILLIVQFFITTGFRHPNEVWSLFEEYASAMEDKNNEAIIEIGDKIFKVYEDLDMCFEISSVICPKYKNSALAYLELGDYDNAKAYLEKHLELTRFRMENYSVDETDNILDGEALLKNIAITPSIYAFTKNDSDITNYRAINEPAMGSYFGRVIAGQDDKWEPREDESAVLIYVEFFQENINDFFYMYEKQSAADKVIELAWNFPNLYDDCEKILLDSSDEYIKNNLKYLSTIDTPILLRIGAEQNCWANPNPELYKKAYIKIAKFAREICPDVALVFSLNSIGDRTYTYNDFYPGDEYVDWVGVSLYCNKYFGDNDSEYEQVAFAVGPYANPIATMKGIVDEFGDRKPIIISEGGSGHYYKSKNENLTEFADKMLAYYYGCLPVVYPQIKCIMYFDTDVATSKYTYSLKKNSQLQASFKKLTHDNPVFIKEIDKMNGSYVKINQFSDKIDDKLRLASYLAFPDFPDVNIKYYIDDKLVANINNMPSVCEIDVNQIPMGSSQLKVEFSSDIGYKRNMSYNIFKGNNGVITIKDIVDTGNEVVAKPSACKVLVNGESINFEAYNINSNTFLKLRDIAEVLKNTEKTFNIKWNTDTKGIDLLAGIKYESVGGELESNINAIEYNSLANNSVLSLDGTSFKSTAYTIHQNNFFKLRDLGQLLDFSVEWNATEKSIEIITSSGYNPE